MEKTILLICSLLLVVVMSGCAQQVNKDEINSLALAATEKHIYEVWIDSDSKTCLEESIKLMIPSPQDEPLGVEGTSTYITGVFVCLKTDESFKDCYEKGPVGVYFVEVDIKTKETRVLSVPAQTKRSIKCNGLQISGV